MTDRRHGPGRSSTLTASTTTATASAATIARRWSSTGTATGSAGGIRFGASVRNYKDEQITRYAGDFLDVELDASGTMLAIPIRPYRQVNRALYSSFYVGCALTR
jgi:hypothetical protein